MRHIPLLLFCLHFLISCSTDAPPKPAASPERSPNALSSESLALKESKSDDCRVHISKLTRQHRVAGSPESRGATDYVASTLGSMGYQVKRHSFHVLIPTPNHVAVELTRPLAFSARIQEPSIDVDLDTIDSSLPIPSVSFSADGDIEAECVYVGHGKRSDFDYLISKGIAVQGRICICRLGETHPASIAALCEEHGAAGLLYYSDPAEDGFTRGDVYPRGGFRPLESAHRVTALRFFQQQGDPGTPGWPSVEGAEQLPFDEMKSLPRIPLAVLSAADAQPILESLRGPVVPPAWQGALPITYHVGGTRHTVCHLTTRTTLALRQIEVIEATWPDQDLDGAFIVVGADRDSLGNGAAGSAGATSVLLETAQQVAARYRAGARFHRAIHFLSWDAGALGGIGISEWAQLFAEDLKGRCVAYVDIPHGAQGDELNLARSPALSTVTAELTQLISTQRPEQLTWTSINHSNHVTGPRSTLLTTLGIPTLSVTSTGNFGLAGSLHDTLGAIRRHVDPGMQRHAALTGIVAAVCFRLCEAPTPPLHLGALGWDILSHCKQLEEEHPELDLSAFHEVATRIGNVGDRIQQQLWTLTTTDISASARTTINQNMKLLLGMLLQSDPQSGLRKHWIFQINPDNAEELRMLPTLDRALMINDPDKTQSAAEDLLTVLLRYADALTHVNLVIANVR